MYKTSSPKKRIKLSARTKTKTKITASVSKVVTIEQFTTLPDYYQSCSSMTLSLTLIFFDSFYHLTFYYHRKAN